MATGARGGMRAGVTVIVRPPPTGGVLVKRFTAGNIKRLGPLDPSTLGLPTLGLYGFPSVTVGRLCLLEDTDKLLPLGEVLVLSDYDHLVLK